MTTHRKAGRDGRGAGLLALVVATTLVALSACGSGSDPEEATMHLEITASDSPDVVTVGAAEGAETTVASRLVGDFEVEVESVDGDRVEFSTSEDLAPEGETGGINLNDLRSDFAVTKGGEVKFSTPTTDESTTWTATLQDGPPPS